MKFNEKLFEDFTKVASGAASALSGIREHVESSRGFGKTDFISRAEFDAVAAMAAKAREAQEALLQRIVSLEEELAHHAQAKAHEQGGE